MGDVIRFPCRPPEIEELRAFGSVGGLTVSMVRERGDETAPVVVALVSDKLPGGLKGVMAFKPEGREVAEIVGAAVMRTLVAVGLPASVGRTPQIWGIDTDQEPA